MTDQSGGGSPVWLGVALIFVGLASKDLFISDNQGELLHYVTCHHIIDSFLVSTLDIKTAMSRSSLMTKKLYFLILQNKID